MRKPKTIRCDIMLSASHQAVALVIRLLDQLWEPQRSMALRAIAAYFGCRIEKVS